MQHVIESTQGTFLDDKGVLEIGFLNRFIMTESLFSISVLIQRSDGICVPYLSIDRGRD